MVLFEIMSALSDAEREKAAFVFFDLEEMGLIGSASFASKHKKQMRDKPLINFDCVSDGNHFLFVLRKKAVHLNDIFAESFPYRLIDFSNIFVNLLTFSINRSTMAIVFL